MERTEHTIGSPLETREAQQLPMSERFSLLTGWMADEARRFDALEVEKLDLQDRLVSPQNTLENGVDIEKTAEEHPGDVAFAAL